MVLPLHPQVWKTFLVPVDGGTGPFILVDALLEALIDPVNHGVFVLPEEILLFCEVIL